MGDRLSEIRARYEAIIPGPWRWFGNTATDQVYLATTDRGRLMILMPGIRTTESVFHHGYFESYDKSSISNTQVKEWCGAHDGEERQCMCEDIAYFLQGELSPEDGYREFDQGGVQLSRGVSVHEDLRFPDMPNAGWTAEALERRKLHGGHMRSYREMARYEVLGTLDRYFHDYRTRAEFEKEASRPATEALYREDFCSLDQPEATFIEHAPEDIGYLLERVAELEAQLEGD